MIRTSFTHMLGRIGLPLALCLALVPEGWTLVIRLSDKELVQGAEYVLTGRVKSHESAWNQDHSRIYTIWTILPERFLKGKEESLVKVRTMGGMVGETGAYIPDSPRFTDGQRVLLFLVREEGDSTCCRVHGWQQGKFTIGEDGMVLERKMPLPAFLEHFDFPQNTSK